MGPQSRTYWLNLILASVPDLVVSWAAARFTDSGWSGFFIALIGLQAIYLFFWFKNALWSWLLFWIYRKRRLAAHFENYLIDSRFPVPNEYTTDFEVYLNEVLNNEKLDAMTRIKAASDLGTINGLRLVQKYSAILQLGFAGDLALKRYARLANRFAQV